MLSTYYQLLYEEIDEIKAEHEKALIRLFTDDSFDTIVHTYTIPEQYRLKAFLNFIQFV